MENRCVCCGAIIPEGRMVCPICEMEADETETVRLLEGGKYGRQSASVNRRKTGRNGKAAVCHLFKRKEV